MYYLVINLGLRSIRALLLDERGQVHSMNWYPVQTVIDHQRVEQNPIEWWKLTGVLLHEVFDKNEDYRKNLKSITVTASACCLVMLDKKDQPVDNSYLVSDKRSMAEANTLAEDKTLAELFKNPNFLPSPSFMIPKMIWFYRHNKRKFKTVTRFMGANDYLLYKLTGTCVTDSLNAEKFYFDSNTQSYPKKLLKQLGVTPKQLPKVQPVGTVLGPVKKEIARELGLSAKVSVIVTTYDAICAFLGSGALQEGESCNVCGTVSSIRAFTQQNVKPNGGILKQQMGDFSIVGGSNNIDGGLLEWSKNMFYGDSYPEKYVYKIMEDEASLSPAGSKGLVFLPYLIGERLPFFNAHARGVFFGLERFHKRNDIMRSVFEASGFMANDIISTIEKSGVNIHTIRMSGGMARNSLLCQIRADITGKNILLIDEVEITSLGAFFIMRKALKEIKKYEEVLESIKIKQQYQPNPQHHAMYQQLFSFFKKLYHGTEELMKTRNELHGTLLQSSRHILENL